MTGTWIKVARLSANALFPAPLLPIITVRWLRDWNIGLTADICRTVHTLIESIGRGRSFQSSSRIPTSVNQVPPGTEMLVTPARNTFCTLRADLRVENSGRVVPLPFPSPLISG